MSARDVGGSAIDCARTNLTVARLALHPLFTNIQTSWVKMGLEGAKLCLDAGASTHAEAVAIGRNDSERPGLERFGTHCWYFTPFQRARGAGAVRAPRCRRRVGGHSS